MESTTVSFENSARSIDFTSGILSSKMGGEEQLAKKMLTEASCDGGKSIWQATIETYMMQDSKGKRGDFHCEHEEEGFACLSAIVEEKKIEVDMAPLQPFGASKDDLIRVFVKWCHKEETGKYNISKAFRRLQDYVEWMDKNCKGFDFNPETMKEAYDAWGFFLTHDKNGRLVWWGDCDLNDFDRIKHEIPYDDTLRYFTYLSHAFMFDAGAQEHGMVCVDQMGNKSVIDYLTMIPMDLGAKLDRISVGILPVKMKKMYMYNCARWMWIIAGLMAPFASPKMRKRVCFLRGNPQKRFAQDLGPECIPKKMLGVKGMAETDILAQLFGKKHCNVELKEGQVQKWPSENESTAKSTSTISSGETP